MTEGLIKRRPSEDIDAERAACNIKAEIRVIQRDAKDCQQTTRSQERSLEQIIPHSPQEELIADT